MQLVEIGGIAAVQIWRKWQLSEIRGSSRCLRLEDAFVQKLDDHLFEMKHNVGSTKADDYTTTNPAIGQLLRLLFFHFL